MRKWKLCAPPGLRARPDWVGDPVRNVLHADYRWQAPEIPAKVRTFNE